MKIGMLWFDNSPQPNLAAKVQRAAAYYRQKYSRDPNACFVHPSVQPTEIVVDGITVKPSRQVMPDHLWMGVEVCAQTTEGV